MVKHSQYRTGSWVDSLESSLERSPERDAIIQGLLDGAISDAHVKTHAFRDKSDNANIYVRKYMSSMDRSILSEFKHKEANLPIKLYNPKDPNRKHFLRPK